MLPSPGALVTSTQPPAAVIASGVLGKEAGPAKVAERLEQTARLPAYAEGDSASGFGAGIVDLGRATNPDVRTD